jgi:predicted DNA-binding transcriptional regulator AlpA
MQPLTTQQAAKYLTLSPATLEKWRCTGGGPRFIRYSARCIRYAQNDLDSWLAQRMAANTSQNHLYAAA